MTQAGASDEPARSSPAPPAPQRASRAMRQTAVRHHGSQQRSAIQPDSDGPNPNVAVTPDERAYLARLGPVRLCVDPDWEPYEHLTPDGAYVGIAADLVRLIAERAGVTLQVIATTDWPQTLDLAARGGCHAVACLNDTPERGAYLRFTEPYLIEPNVFVTRAEHRHVADPAELGRATVAVPAGSSVQERLQGDYPALRMHVVDDERSALEAVRAGRADATLRSLSMAAHVIRQAGWGDLRIAGEIPTYLNRLRIGVVLGEPLLRDLLDRAVATLTPADVQDAIARHVAVDHALLRDMSTLVAQARTASEQLRTVIDAVPNYIFVHDAEHRVRLVNEAFAAALALRRPADAIGRTLVDLGIPTEQAQALCALEAGVIADGAKRTQPKLALPRPDGTDGWFHLTLTPYRLVETGADAALGVATDITDRVLDEERIRHQAQHDPLTGLANRATFTDRLHSALASASDHGTGLAVLLADLDHFKETNDRHGHLAGDELLRQAARRMHETVRTSDTVSRMGGDEFAILLPDVGSIEGALAVAEKLRSVIDQPFHIADLELRVTASIGAALYPLHGNDVTSLLHHADTALYQAKAGGRNAACAFDPNDAPTEGAPTRRIGPRAPR